MLYLFDIDGTLVDTAGAGLAAIVEANREIFGGDGPPLDLAGATDLGVIAHIHLHFGVEATPASMDRFWESYLVRLRTNLASGIYPGRIFDGVSEILAELSAREGTSMGLLTGNTAHGAAAKMEHFGLASHFAFGAYGCDHADRNRLGPVALERAAAHTGRTFTAGETWIIGDTPKDIACAHAIGARCLAVATGRFTTDELKAHGADKVVETLEEAAGLI